MIDFGDTNCLGLDGNLRRGVLRITLSGPYRDSATVITTITNDYYLNNNKIEGQKVKTNKGRNSDGNLVFDVAVTNGKITKPDNSFSEWTSSRQSVWSAGENSLLDWSDDEYRISGTGSGKTVNGRNYTMNITEDLMVALNCRWIKAGKVLVDPEDTDNSVLDFGDGSCDAKATYTIKNQTINFNIALKVKSENCKALYLLIPNRILMFFRYL